jgi:hypothetical protein
LQSIIGAKESASKSLAFFLTLVLLIGVLFISFSGSLNPTKANASSVMYVDETYYWAVNTETQVVSRVNKQTGSIDSSHTLSCNQQDFVFKFAKTESRLFFECYTTGDSGRIHAFDLTTGSLLFSEDLLITGDRYRVSSDGMIIYSATALTEFDQLGTECSGGAIYDYTIPTEVHTSCFPAILNGGTTPWIPFDAGGVTYWAPDNSMPSGYDCYNMWAWPTPASPTSFTYKSNRYFVAPVIDFDLNGCGVTLDNSGLSGTYYLSQYMGGYGNETVHTSTRGKISPLPSAVSTLTFSSTILSSDLSVSYTTDGALGTPPSASSHLIESSFTVPTPSLTKEGYSFKEWTDGTLTYAPGTTYKLGTNSVTLQAVWQANTIPAAVTTTTTQATTTTTTPATTTSTTTTTVPKQLPATR